MLKWLSFGNAAIRPAGASFRDKAAAGEAYDNGLPELNEFLSKTLGYLSLQEDIMMFLQKFCGYSGAESDNVRRAIAKKKGTEDLLPEIERRFIDYTSTHYDATREQCQDAIKPFLQIILDASNYGFSWNHSDAYSALGYICGWLRYYYPLEFVTAGLNVFYDNHDKTSAIVKYANKQGIKVLPIKFRHSIGQYSLSKEENAIYKGIASIKYLNDEIASSLYALKNMRYGSFGELLYDISRMNIDARQLRVLISLDYFSEFGGAQKLLRVADAFDLLFSKASKNWKRLLGKDYPEKLALKPEELGQFAGSVTEKSYTKVDTAKLLLYIEETTEDKPTDVLQKIVDEVEYLGYAETKDARYSGLAYVSNLKLWYGTYEMACYSVKNGIMFGCKMSGKDYKNNPFKEGDFITIESHKYKPRFKKVGDKFEAVPGSKVLWLTKVHNVKKKVDKK